MKKGLLAGSFDPPTLGHIDIIERASVLCDELTVGIAINPLKIKTAMLTTEEKTELLCLVLNKLQNVKVKSFGGLVVDFAKHENASYLVRGLRAFSDFEYEFRMAIANKRMASLETIFLMADLNLSHINSSLIREIAAFKGSIEPFVPKIVAEKLQKKL